METKKEIPNLLEKLHLLKDQAEKAMQLADVQKESALASQKKFEDAVLIVIKLAKCASHEVSTIKKMAEAYAITHLEGFKK